MKLIYTIFFVFTFHIIFGQVGYPVPKPSDNRLFYIQHSNNKNTFVYDLNVKNKVLDTKNPIHIYRITYENGAIIEPLSTAQRKLAYGIDFDKSSGTNYTFHIVSYKNQKLNLVKVGSNYKVQTTINGKNMYLIKMFINTKDATIKPKVNWINFTGTEVATGKLITEKLLIN